MNGCMMNLNCNHIHIVQDDVEVPIPHYFISENSKTLKERDKMLGTILAQMGPQDATEVQCIYLRLWYELFSHVHLTGIHG